MMSDRAIHVLTSSAVALAPSNAVQVSVVGNRGVSFPSADGGESVTNRPPGW